MVGKLCVYEGERVGGVEEKGMVKTMVPEE